MFVNLGDNNSQPPHVSSLFVAQTTAGPQQHFQKSKKGIEKVEHPMSNAGTRCDAVRQRTTNPPAVSPKASFWATEQASAAQPLHSKGFATCKNLLQGVTHPLFPGSASPALSPGGPAMAPANARCCRLPPPQYMLMISLPSHLRIGCRLLQLGLVSQRIDRRQAVLKLLASRGTSTHESRRIQSHSWQTRRRRVK